MQAFMKRPFNRLFSTSALRASNIGSAPILLPEGTKLSLSTAKLDEVSALRASVDRLRGGKPRIYTTQTVSIAGPLGKLEVALADFVRINIEGNKAAVEVEQPTQRYQRSMWGTSRSLVANAVAGVNEGHLCIVKLVGTGFRATLDEKKREITLRLGFSVPRIAKIPEGITVKVPVPHRIIIEGCDKQQVKLLAATIRAFRKPEPFKGKGVFIDDETIKLKQKKIK